MRVAAIYDVHGNPPALEAVLAEVRELDVDLVVFGGDVVPGPMPREALSCLLNLDLPVRFIQGNCEVAVLSEMAGADLGKFPEHVREAMRWSAGQLDVECKRQMASWPKTIRLEVPGLGKLLFCHGTPRSEDECLTRLTPAARILPAFEGLDVALVVCGHTHMQFDRMVGRVRVVNAGSVGMPFGQPGAYWLLPGPDVKFRHTRYDLERAAERIRATDYPQASEFAAKNVLQPPSEEDMLRVFSRAESESTR
jgi:putative phosphoesterase